MGVTKEKPGPNDIVDSELAEDSAFWAGERPEVKRWCRRLKRLLKDMPDGIEVFVGEGVAVLAQGPNGEHFMTDTGSKDTSAIIDSIGSGNALRWDGGGW